jgi:hypothetical protein
MWLDQRLLQSSDTSIAELLDSDSNQPSTQQVQDACAALDALPACPSFATCTPGVIQAVTQLQQSLACDDLYIDLGSDSDSDDSAGGGDAPPPLPPPPPPPLPPPPPSPPPLPSPPPPLTTLAATAFDGYLAGCGVRLVATSGEALRLEAAVAVPASATTDAAGRWVFSRNERTLCFRARQNVGTRAFCSTGRGSASAVSDRLTGLAGVSTRPAGYRCLYPRGGVPPATERMLHLYDSPAARSPPRVSDRRHASDSRQNFTRAPPLLERNLFEP